jgi:glycosyltransferase involved in cell wall biosynthesis
VVVCSEALLRSKSLGRHVVLIPNAVDLEPYRVLQPRPDDLPPGPVALYLGTVHLDRIDVDLVVKTAAGLAGGAGGVLVMVGPAPLPQADVERLTSAGVHLLGPRPSQAVPAYLQHASVLVVPHVLTDFTASLDPIKAYEYRAARRPVVATRVPGFVDHADPWVESVAPEEFPQAVARAAGRSGAWRADLPDDIPSWSQRVAEMSTVLARVEAQVR